MLGKRLRKRFRLGYAFFNKRCCVHQLVRRMIATIIKRSARLCCIADSTISIHRLQMCCAPRWVFHEIAGSSRHQFREPSTHFLAVSFTIGSNWT